MYDKIKIYKEDKLFLELSLTESNHNYIDFIAYSDIGVIQILKKFIDIPESSPEYKILYSRVRGEDYKILKKNKDVK